MGRFIVIVVVVGLLFLAIMSSRLVWLSSYGDGDALAGWGKGEVSKVESEYYYKRIRRIIKSWQNAADRTAQRRNDGRIEQPNDVFLVIDIKKPAMWIEFMGQVVQKYYTELPENMEWQIHHVTPDGDKPLPDVVRLRVRGVYTDRLFAEMIFLGGGGTGGNMDFSIRSRGLGSGKSSGGQVTVPKYNKKKPKEGAEVYKSIIVDNDEHVEYLNGLKERDAEGIEDDIVDKFFHGSDQYWANFKKWRAVEKRMYAEMARQLSREGYELSGIEVATGPDYLAGHAELDGRDYGMFGGGSVDVNLNFEHLGEGVWHVFSASGRISNRGRAFTNTGQFSGSGSDDLKLDFVVTADGEIDADKVERLKAAKLKAVEAEINKPGLPKWRAKLDNGVVVVFIGLCESPSGGKKWFGPDGSQVDNVPYPNYFRFGRISDNLKMLEFAWMVHWPKGSAGSRSPRSVEGYRGASSRDAIDKYGYRMQSGKHRGETIAYKFDKDRDMTTLKLGYKVKGQTDFSYVRFENISLVRGKDMGFTIVVEEEE